MLLFTLGKHLHSIIIFFLLLSLNDIIGIILIVVVHKSLQFFLHGFNILSKLYFLWINFLQNLHSLRTNLYIILSQYSSRCLTVTVICLCHYIKLERSEIIHVQEGFSGDFELSGELLFMNQFTFISLKV